jgi:hypothetical protein
MLSSNGNFKISISTFLHKINAKIKPQKMTKLLYVKFYVYQPFGGSSPSSLCLNQKC